MLNYSCCESNKKYNLYGNANPLGNTASDGTIIGNESGTKAGFQHSIILDRFISFMAGKPSYIDTWITGEIILTISLAPAADVLYKPEDTAADSTAPSYTLSDIYATLSKVQISDGFYFASIQSALAQNLPFKMMFNHFETATSSKSGNQTMNMRTEIQIDYVDLTWFSFMRPSSHYKQTAAAANKQWEENTNHHKYLTRSLQDVNTLSFNVNGMTIPN